MEKSITYVDLDVHKKTVAVALAESEKRGEVREHGEIANTPEALRKLTSKLARAGRELSFCYEAGPCGYGIQRQLTEAGQSCVVVAPSLIPRKPGDRIKTDRRDAVNLAKLHRAGELTAVWVPDEAHEAMRDLVRARLAAVRSLRQARQQLSGFLLRHGHHYHRPAWTLMHRRWLAGLRFQHAVHHIVLEDSIAAVEAATARRDGLAVQIAAMLPSWSLAPVVRALQALRGIAPVAAATLVAELGDITRFTSARHLMAYLGLGAADPRDRLESTAAPVPPLSQTGQHRQARNRCDHRDRARVSGLRLGHCPTGCGSAELASGHRHLVHGGANVPPTFCSPARLGARSRSGEPSHPLSAGAHPMLVARQRQLRDEHRSCGPNPRIRG
jgi:transposase